jgi:hypothetical protein
MDPELLAKVPAKTAQEVCARYQPSRAAAEALQNGLTPGQFVETLAQAKKYQDAMEFFIHALSPREAVWWACLAIRHAHGQTLPPKEQAALKAAVEWVLEPDEPKRRAARGAAEASGFDTPAGCAALAAGCVSSDQSFPLTRAVANALAMSCAKVERQIVPALHRELFELGLAIAKGKAAWPNAN